MIDWNNVPDWVNYIATDANGATYYYEQKPTMIEDCWVSGQRSELVTATHDWRQSLTCRYWPDGLPNLES